MQATLHRLFLSHPRTVDKSYGQHFAFAFGFAARLFGAGSRRSYTRSSRACSRARRAA